MIYVVKKTAKKPPPKQTLLIRWGMIELENGGGISKMSKLTRNPLLSLGAKGTLAKTLTFQRIHRTNIVRHKPIPSDPRTLAQIYQRWDYQNFIAYWHTLTASEKQTWKSNASRHHMTGFAYWMRSCLLNLTDIAGRWRLDSIFNSKTPDSSKYLNHATVYGAYSLTGVVDKALYFDGGDDYLDCGDKVWLPVTDSFALLAWIKTTRDQMDIANVYNVITGAYLTLSFSQWDPGKLRIATRDNTNQVLLDLIFPTTSNDGLWHRVAAFRQPGTLGLAVDAQLHTVADPRTGFFNFAKPFYIAKNLWEGWSLGPVDDVILLSRTLSQADFTRDYERRYP